MRDHFYEQGYFKSKINPLNLTAAVNDDLNVIRDNFNSLTKDPYSDQNSNRFRAYSNAIIIPWERKLIWSPLENKDGRFVSSYWQGGFNLEHVDSLRSFTPLTKETKNTNLLHNLIIHDFDLTFWKAETLLPIYVGVHFVKLLVMDSDQIAYSSPNLLHRDGEAFTFAHLFNRYNLQGGVNYIAAPELANSKIEDIAEEKILSKFELHEPFETYGVCDQLVSHYVSPVRLQNPDLLCGYRQIILVDFSPVQQKLR